MRIGNQGGMVASVQISQYAILSPKGPFEGAARHPAWAIQLLPRFHHAEDRTGTLPRPPVVLGEKNVRRREKMQTELPLEKKMPFEAFGLRPEILRAVAEKNYTIPRPSRSRRSPLCSGEGPARLRADRHGQDRGLRAPDPASAPVGPGRHRRRPIRVLVLSPTRELASQIADSFSRVWPAHGPKHAVVFGGVSQGPQAQALRQGVDILVATPGRLLDLMTRDTSISRHRNARPRRSRPDARHGLHPRHPASYRRAAREAADADVLGDHAERKSGGSPTRCCTTRFGWP